MKIIFNPQDRHNQNMFVNYVTQKKTLFRPSFPLSQIFQRKKSYICTVSNFSTPPPQRDVICDRPHISKTYIPSCHKQSDSCCYKLFA